MTLNWASTSLWIVSNPHHHSWARDLILVQAVQLCTGKRQLYTRQLLDRPRSVTFSCMHPFSPSSSQGRRSIPLYIMMRAFSALMSCGRGVGSRIARCCWGRRARGRQFMYLISLLKRQVIWAFCRSRFSWFLSLLVHTCDWLLNFVIDWIW